MAESLSRYTAKILDFAGTMECEVKPLWVFRHRFGTKGSALSSLIHALDDLAYQRRIVVLFSKGFKAANWDVDPQAVIMVWNPITDAEKQRWLVDSDAPT